MTDMNTNENTARHLYAQKLEVLRRKTFFPDSSSTPLIGSAPGPVTMISETFLMVGSEKSTCFNRSGVIVRLAAAMSPRPSSRAGMMSSRPITGMSPGLPI